MMTIAKFTKSNTSKFIPTIKTNYGEAKRFMKYFYRAYKVKLYMFVFEIDEFATPSL